MHNRKHGFTLVEVLLVVMILAIIAAITIPKLTNASSTAKSSMLADDLRLLRTQIAVYNGQHTGVSPGYPDGDSDATATEDAFIDQMTRHSNANGETSATRSDAYRFGPYMSEMPTNPVNGKTTVEILGAGEAFPADGDDSHGYIYQPSTLKIKADSPGNDPNGRAYSDY